MKFIKLKCPSCNASLEINESIVFCKYCGAKLLLDDEAKNVNFTYRKIDEARIKENERKENIKLKELEYQEKEKEREHKQQKGALIALCSIMAVCFIVLAILLVLNKPNENEIRMVASAEEYKGDNYEQVAKELENLGFTNIEFIAQEDLVLGLINKDGSIERISINGNFKFDDYDYFPKDAEVLITYHTYKTNNDTITQQSPEKAQPEP